MKVCFHVHSNYSNDSLLSLEKIAQIAKKNKIDVVILADHNNLAPNNEINKIKDVKIIPGEEIKTNQGEIIGIFLKEKIKSNLSLEETIKKIKEQNGLVVVPHPFDLVRVKRIKKNVLLRNLEKIDLIEIFNSRTFFNCLDKKAENFAEKYRKNKIVGSDAHSQFELNKAIIEMENFSDQLDFLKKLKKAKFYTQKSNFFLRVFVFLLSRLSKIFNHPL